MEELDQHLISVRSRTPEAYLAAALCLLRDVCRGVDFLHSVGFVHRDLAPRNMLIENMPGDSNGAAHAKVGVWGQAPSPNPNPNAKVGDFGQARRIPEGASYVLYGEDVYDRSLLAPENYGIQGYHSLTLTLALTPTPTLIIGCKATIVRRQTCSCSVR